MHLLQTDPKAQRLLKQENRITLKDGILVRKYYGECGQVTHNQIVLPTHIIPELMRTLLGTSGRHPGITKMIQQCRRKYYYPDLASHINQWVTNCQDCIKHKRINLQQIRAKMIDPTEVSLGPGFIIEIDILPNLPCSAGYKHIVTMIDVFSRYIFASSTKHVQLHVLPITKHDGPYSIVDAMTRHAYLPTCMISDKGSQFRAEVIQEITKVLDIEVSHATTKHAQTIGILERTHASLKISLKYPPEKGNQCGTITSR